MSRGIPESDWKIYSALNPIALERLCEKILAEARAEIGRPNKSAHARYQDLYQLILDRDRDIAGAFNEFSRSRALMKLGMMHSLGLLTGEEIRRFTPETQQIIALSAPIPKS